MSEQNTTFILENSCLVQDETHKCPDFNLIPLDFIKDEIPTYQNTDDINQSYHIEDGNIVNKSNSITLESFDVDAINVLKIKTEKDCGYTDTQNSILVIENNFFVKDEIDIKEEILTYVNNDDSNETYHMENITMNTDKCITIDNLNSCVEIKTEKDCKDTSIQNSIFVIEDEYSVKVEKISFPSTNDNPSYYNEEVFNKIKQLSPAYCDIFKENIYEVKTEIDYKSNIFGTSIKDFKNNQEDVKKHNTIQLESITNDDRKHYKCDICQKSYTGIGALNKHMFTHTSETPYKCDICKKAFIMKCVLNKHMFTHTNEKPHKCNICQKSFICNSKLKMHMFTHTGIKPYKCNICHKSYTGKCALNRHMFTHTSEKPYKCDICLKSFAQKDTIEKHMFTHNREKPYKCNICLKLFTRKPYLNDHIVTHTGKKPHKCKICQKSFSQKGILSRHMFTHTSEKPNKCNICQKSFIRKSELKTHMLTCTGKKKK